MPATPALRRGRLYPTALYQRCCNFHQCARCFQCRSYHPGLAACRYCESVKIARPTCECTLDQEGAVIQLTDKIGRPLFDPNAEMKEVKPLATTAFDHENKELVERLDGLRAQKIEKK